MRSFKINWATGRIPLSIGVALASAALTIVPASATQVKVPKANPRVMLDVPDGWTVEYTDLGLELRAPEKDSIVIGTVMKRAKGAVDAWKQKVLTRMEDDGVTVGKETKAPEPPKEAAAAPSPKPKGPVEDLPGTATKPTFSFAGGPSLDMPSLGNNPAAKLGAPSTAATAQKGEPMINGLSLQSYRLEGGMFKGKPTDIQLALFSLSNNELFVVEQQSASEDNRAAGIMSSVKQVKR